jgi:hypothetical protein
LSRKKRTWTKRAWVDPAFDYIEEHPGCGLNEVADHVGVHPNTVRKHSRVMNAINFANRELWPGFRDVDGDVDGIVEADE